MSMVGLYPSFRCVLRAAHRTTSPDDLDSSTALSIASPPVRLPRPNPPPRRVQEDELDLPEHLANVPMSFIKDRLRALGKPAAASSRFCVRELIHRFAISKAQSCSRQSHRTKTQASHIF